MSEYDQDIQPMLVCPTHGPYTYREFCRECSKLLGLLHDMAECHCDGNPAGGVCSYPDCQLPPPTTEELLESKEARIRSWYSTGRC